MRLKLDRTYMSNIRSMVFLKIDDFFNCLIGSKSSYKYNRSIYRLLGDGVGIFGVLQCKKTDLGIVGVSILSLLLC